ncbi:MAG: hypothetical protein JXQ90_11710 [Cyclobacteriaceae bacterium]
MNRVSYRVLGFQFFIFVVIQIPLLYKLVLGGSAFGFFYCGFLLLLPYGLSPIVSLLLGFGVGLIIDIPSSTPGMHAAACTFIMFVRDFWLRATLGEPDEDSSISLSNQRLGPFLSYLYPLILVHHVIMFFIEHGKLQGFLMILQRAFLSSLFSFVLVLILSFVLTSKKSRS